MWYTQAFQSLAFVLLFSYFMCVFFYSSFFVRFSCRVIEMSSSFSRQSYLIHFCIHLLTSAHIKFIIHIHVPCFATCTTTAFNRKNFSSSTLNFFLIFSLFYFHIAQSSRLPLITQIKRNSMHCFFFFILSPSSAKKKTKTLKMTANF